MKAFSLWQPWASLWIAPEAKIHETRSWSTKYRGWLAVHAAKRKPEAFFGEAWTEASAIIPATPGLPCGGIIGLVDLIECVGTFSPGPASDRDRLFGNWTPGRYAWRRAPVLYRLARPVPCRGFQGIWNLDPSMLPTKLAVVAFSGTRRSVADAAGDAGSMDFVGMDASLPQALAAFVGE